MKKLLLIISIISVILLNSNAQKFEKGNLAFNAGLGLGYTVGLYTGANSIPLLFASGEMGIYDWEGIGVISVGGIIAYKRISYTAYVYDWSWSDLYIGGRGLLHINELVDIDKVDIYGGISLGVRFYTSPVLVNLVDLEKKTYSKLFSGAFIGGRYYLTDKISAYGELGYDVAYLKLGVSFKLK